MLNKLYQVIGQLRLPSQATKSGCKLHFIKLCACLFQFLPPPLWYQVLLFKKDEEELDVRLILWTSFNLFLPFEQHPVDLINKCHKS